MYIKDHPESVKRELFSGHVISVTPRFSAVHLSRRERQTLRAAAVLSDKLCELVGEDTDVGIELGGISMRVWGIEEEYNNLEFIPIVEKR